MNFIFIIKKKNEASFMASEKPCGWERQREVSQQPRMSAGKGTDVYMECWRSCLYGVKYKTFKLYLLEKLQLKRYVILQGILTFWCFLRIRLQAESAPSSVLRFIQVTIRVLVIPSWATSDSTTCVYHVFSGLWFGFWNACTQAELHDSESR